MESWGCVGGAGLPFRSQGSWKLPRETADDTKRCAERHPKPDHAEQSLLSRANRPKIHGMVAPQADELFEALQRKAAPSPFSIRERLGRFLADPKLPILRRLARAQMAEYAALREQMPVVRYAEARSYWQLKALRAEHFGERAAIVPPPRSIPSALLDRCSRNGK